MLYLFFLFLESNPPLIPINLVLTPRADSLTVSWQPNPSNIIVRGYKVRVVDQFGQEKYSGDLLGRGNTELKLYNGISKSFFSFFAFWSITILLMPS